MKILNLIIELEQPVLATQILGDPNSSVSFDYLPGSQLRGMLIHRYMAKHGLQEHQATTDADCQRLFFSGATRFLNAYLAVDNRRTLPAPLGLLRRKGADQNDTALWNASHNDWNAEERRTAEGDATLTPLGRQFCTVDNDNERLSSYSTKPNEIAVHTFRDRRAGRATQAYGAVFRYDALAAGQRFHSNILVDNEQDTGGLKELLEGTAWIGRSRSAGYGRVRLSYTDARGNWREVGGSLETIAAGDTVSMTLLSDTILRDAHGNAVTTISNDVLSAYLGVPVTIDPTRSFSAPILHGGFNRTWRMPLAQTYALQAGSIITFKVQQPPDALRIEQQGIGHRCTEGFGRVAFNWLTEMDMGLESGTPTSFAYTSVALSPQSTSIATHMAKRLLEQQIAERINRFVRDKILDNQSARQKLPNPSQLGRVRVLVRQAAQGQQTLASIPTKIESFKDTSKRQFKAARLNGVSLYDWLRDMLANNGERVWQELDLQPAQWPRMAGQQFPTDEAFTRRTALQLIDAVLAAASKAKKQQREQQGAAQ